MNEAVIATITKAKSRQSLYHFTRARNLPVIAHFDALLSSNCTNPASAGERRTKAMQVNYENYSITINAHLRIPDRMIDAASSQEQFRTCLDRHVFFWPTRKDCRKMMDTYARREPDERFAVLEFDAHSLIMEHYAAVKLSKYDSGSAPRFPASCSYKKSPEMFLPISSFKRIMNNTVPTVPSEIREVLIEDRVMNVSKHLRAVYAGDCQTIPERWKERAKPLSDMETEGI
ncbi:DUF7002 family protein [Paenibacillus sp. MBLB4367]|uniref:DUF7002 family protein n=1 Tax=Paenibacillus sp. MBLB4367 TaxID=3384767 RepID=UPI003907FA00